MLTIQILTKNNQSTIHKVLESITKLEGKVIVGDLGSIDGTLDVCSDYGAEIVQLGQTTDYSKARNSLTSPEWNLWLKPNEILAFGHDEIRKPKSPGTFHLRLFHGPVITKEIRYWFGNELKFQNPIYETLKNTQARGIKAGVYTDGKLDEPIEIIDQWLEKSGGIRPHYYKTFKLLAEGKYHDFLVCADHYLSRDTSSKSAIMLRYYMAKVQLHIISDTSTAVRNTLACLAARPLMAEFWCLLGDIYYHRKIYEKAQVFYENALLLGNQRPDDLWPIEIPKYKQYPQKMIQSCKEISRQTIQIGQTR